MLLGAAVSSSGGGSKVLVTTSPALHDQIQLNQSQNDMKLDTLSFNKNL